VGFTTCERLNVQEHQSRGKTSVISYPWKYLGIRECIWLQRFWRVCASYHADSMVWWQRRGYLRSSWLQPWSGL